MDVGEESSSGGLFGMETMLSGATGRWLLSSGSRRCFRTWKAGQKKEMGR